MGSWNETDMMTGLPIEMGTPVVGFLIISNKITAHELGRTIYADSRWQPISMPIFGVYDGYGRIGNIENTEEIDRAIKKLESIGFRLVCRLHHHLAVKDCSLEVQQGELIPNDYGYDPKQMELVFIRKNLFDFAMRTQNSQEIIREYGITANVYCNAVKTYAPQLKDSNSVETNFVILSEIGKPREQLKHLLGCSMPINTAACKLIEFGFNLAQTAAMTHFLDSMRLQWIPTSGEGSQTTIDSKEKIQFYKLVTRTAKEIYDGEMD